MSNQLHQKAINELYVKLLSNSNNSVRKHRERFEEKLSMFPNFSELPFFIERGQYEELLLKLNLVMDMAKALSQDIVASPTGLGALKDPLIAFFKGYEDLFSTNLQTVIARPDVVITKSGFKVVELNISSSVGGYAASEVAREYFESHPAIHAFIREGSFKLDFKPFGSLFPQKLVEATGKTELVLWDVMTFPLEPLKDQSIIELWLKLLSPYTKVKLLGGFKNKRKYNQQISELNSGSTLFRIFHPSLIDLKSQSYAKILSLLRSGIIYELSNLSEIVISNKVLLADVQSYSELLLGQSEIQSIKELLPATFELGPESKRMFDFKTLVKEKAGWVLKKGGSFASQHVFFGRNTSAAQWGRLVSAGQNEGGWVLQKYYAPVKHLDVFQMANGSLAFTKRQVEIGPYLINGANCGIFCRARNFPLRGPSVMSSTAGIIYEKRR